MIHSRATLVAIALTATWLWLAWGCGRARGPAIEVPAEDGFGDIPARIASYGDIEGAGRLRLEYRDETVDFDFRMWISAGGAVEVDGEVGTSFLPVVGHLTLLSDRGSTVIHTDMGVFDLTEDERTQAVVYPLVLSLFGGADRLVPWLISRGCEPARTLRCGDIELSLEAFEGQQVVKKWQLRQGDGDGSFTGFVHDLGETDLIPRSISGILNPYGVGIYVKYDYVRTTQASTR